jgi:hypothetical protein
MASPSRRRIKRALLWGFGLLVFVQVATWMAWGNAQLRDILAADIVEVTGGHFALDSKSCFVALHITYHVCDELRKVKSIQEMNRRLEAREWQRFCISPRECFGELPTDFWFEAVSSYPVIASVEFGMSPHVLTGDGQELTMNLSGRGEKLTYYWVLGVWIRRGWSDTTWVS